MIVVLQIKGRQVRLGIEAPRDTKIHREKRCCRHSRAKRKLPPKASLLKSKKVAKLLRAS
jgi:carbon storage regulator CsrA